MSPSKSFFIFIIITIGVCTSCSRLKTKDNDILFQTSTFDALLSGNFEGTMTFQELSLKGNFGLGTFNELDGEMLALDGIFYQIKSDGLIYPAHSAMETPFAVVTHFIADTVFQLTENLNYDQLNELIDKLIPTKNIFYAIKIQGEFKQAITRSVPKQKKPYPDLIEVVKDQPLFEFNALKGTMVGFRAPEFTEGINVPAYHYHFMNEEKSKGGHLLKCIISDVTVSIDIIHETQIKLPETETFYHQNLLKDRSEESEIVER